MRLGLEAGLHTITAAADHGIQGVPIDASQLVNEGLAATLQPLQERGLQVCQIGAFGVNPLASDDTQTVMLKRAIEMAADIGCPYIVINGGNYHPSGFLAGDARNFEDAALNKIAEYLEPLLNHAEKHNVKLSLEPYLKGAIHSPQRFLDLKAMFNSDALRINIDVTSFYDYRAMWQPTPVVENVCTRLAGHYGLGHIKDVVLQEGFHIHIDLAPLGSSLTDWTQVLKLMAPNLPDDSWLILEHVSSPEEVTASLEILRTAADAAGVTLE
ncbi:MAG: sugar phosphate isomerase/epimerase family protein [Deinococcota bacterium]